MPIITSVDALEALYGTPGETSTAKEIDYISPEYRAYIEASPFVALATAGPEGLDCSPRGDAGAVVRIQDDRTVLLPDRRGNNRIDSLRTSCATRASCSCSSSPDRATRCGSTAARNSAPTVRCLTPS